MCDKMSQGVGVGRVGPEGTSTVRQFDALTLYAVRQYVTLTQRTAVRQYDALTQHIAVRGYDTLTRGARLTDRGARGVFIFFDLILFFVLVPNCPRLAGRPCQGLVINLE